MVYVWNVLSLLSVSVFIVVTRCEVQNMTINQDGVYRANGTVELYCSFEDPDPKPDFNIIWHHNDELKPLIAGPPNFLDDSIQRFSYQLIIYNASKNDAGRYSCNVEGDRFFVSTTLMEVSVDDDPAVGEIGLNLELNLLRSPNPYVRCFTANTPSKEVLDCKMNIKITETNVGYHDFVIVSDAALLHYKTLEKAEENKVTFIMAKPLIGLTVLWKDDNVIFVLSGDTNHLSDMRLSCSHPQNTIPLDVTKEDSATSDKITFICDRNETISDIDVVVHWKEKILYDKKMTEAGHTSVARCELENLTISQDVVYRTNKTVTLFCSFNDPVLPADIKFIWHHNDNPKPLVTGPPNFPDDSKQIFSYQLRIDNASRYDAGRYSCIVKGDPLVVSTTLTEVSVDDNPAVGEINSNLELNLLSSPNPYVRCFTAKKPSIEAFGCKMNIKVTETDVGYHKFVIVSADALLYYKTLEKAVEKQVTFNMSKPLIGLKVIWNDDNVTFVLSGGTKHLSDTRLCCSHPQNTIPLDVTKEDSATNNKTTFICDRNETMSDLDVLVQWKEKILYFKKVTETGHTSGSRNSQVARILIVASVMSKWLLSKLGVIR